LIGTEKLDTVPGYTEGTTTKEYILYKGKFTASKIVNKKIDLQELRISQFRNIYRNCKTICYNKTTEYVSLISPREYVLY